MGLGARIGWIPGMKPLALLMLNGCTFATPAPAAAEPALPAAPSRAAPAYAQPAFEYRCHGQATWQVWKHGSRDCTGRYPIFIEGEVSPTWCPNGVGSFPDLPWRRVQAGTADWRIVDRHGALLTEMVGPCVTDPSVFDRIDDGLGGCRSPEFTRARQVYDAGCTADSFHTGAAVYAAMAKGYPQQFVLHRMLAVPPYAER